MANNAQAELQTLLRELRSRVPVDAADLLSRESPARIEQALEALPSDLAARIKINLPDARRAELAAADDDEPQLTDLMEPARGIFSSTETVAAATKFLREAASVTDITYLYVTDDQQHLIGMVVMRDLLLAKPEQTLGDIMLRSPFFLRTSMSLREAIQAAVKRHYPVYPVADQQGRFFGLVRGWKLFERHAIEISAQSGRMVGVDKEERIGTPLWDAFRNRHPWLQVNLLTAFLAAFVVGSFEDTISKIVALAAFLPVLAGQSGNNGCQALAITLRGFSLGEIQNLSIRRLLLKEVTLGAINGLLTGVVAGAAMWWSASRDGNPKAMLLGGVIVAAMTGACMISGLFGVLVPLTLKRFGADPATASSIFLTTGTDIASMGLMLTLATVLVL
jgi:magnesium transporter